MDDLVIKQRIIKADSLIDLTNDEKYQLASYGKLWEHQPKTQIIGNGVYDQGVLLITKGSVEISVKLEGKTEVIVPEFSNGFIGEIGYFKGNINRSSIVTTTTYCEGIFFSADNADKLRKHKPDLAQKFEFCLFKSLAEKLQITNRRLLLLRQDYNLVLKKVEEFPGIQEARNMVDDVISQILSPEMTDIIQKAMQIPTHLWDKVLDYVEQLKLEEIKQQQNK